MSQLTCWYCHKPVTGELPGDVFFRAIAICPECIAASPEAENHPAQALNKGAGNCACDCRQKEDGADGCEDYITWGKCKRKTP